MPIFFFIYVFLSYWTKSVLSISFLLFQIPFSSTDLLISLSSLHVITCSKRSLPLSIFRFSADPWKTVKFLPHLRNSESPDVLSEYWADWLETVYFKGRLIGFEWIVNSFSPQWSRRSRDKECLLIRRKRASSPPSWARNHSSSGQPMADNGRPSSRQLCENYRLCGAPSVK